MGYFSTLWVLGGAVAMLASQLLFTYAPFMNKLYNSAPISGSAWLKIVGVAAVAFVAVEFKKWIDACRRKREGHPRTGAASRKRPRA
jgi:cation-transporting ATPase F